jgi:hypothetical protein
LYPTGNPDESYNRVYKGGKNHTGITGVNLSTQTFINLTVDDIAANTMVSYRGIGCHYEKNAALDDICVALLMTHDDVDIVVPGKVWHVHTMRHIGDEHTPGTRQRFEDGTAGKIDLFLRDEADGRIASIVEEDVDDVDIENVRHLSPDELEAMILNLEEDEDEPEEEDGTLEENNPYETQAPLAGRLQPIPEDDAIEPQQPVAPEHARVQYNAARRMVRAGVSMCRVVKKENGIYIGDCRLCYLRLSCPAVVFIRSIELDLIEAMSVYEMTARMKNTKPKPGGRRKLGLGGLNPGIKPADEDTMLDRLSLFFAKRSQEAVKMMCTVPAVRDALKKSNLFPTREVKVEKLWKQFSNDIAHILAQVAW